MAMKRVLPAWTKTVVGLALTAGLWEQAAQAVCGDAADACRIENGSYHIVMPSAPTTDGDAIPALMFLHGWGSSGQGTLNMRGMVEAALARGYAVIAPDGTPREGRNGRSWGFMPDRPGPRDEIAFLRAVRDDAVARHGIDGGRMLLGGFSIGGSMVSYLACADPSSFAAYGPVAGAFWHPLPADCAGPVDLFHTHGWTDGVVPLEGRILGGADSLDDEGVFAQADVWRAMAIWRAANGCRSNASRYSETGIFWRRGWDCDSGRQLDFALFNGGHAVPEGWTAMALDWFEAL